MKISPEDKKAVLRWLRRQEGVSVWRHALVDLGYSYFIKLPNGNAVVPTKEGLVEKPESEVNHWVEGWLFPVRPRWSDVVFAAWEMYQESRLNDEDTLLGQA